LGFEAVYVSGGAVGYALAISEALLTVNDLASLVAAIRRRSSTPIVVDGGVGFGDAVHVARAVWDLEAAGAAAIELEDQVAPKRASHHRGIEHLVTSEEMVGKLNAAVEARRDPDLLIIARTNAIKPEGLEGAVERGRAYLAAGADLLLISTLDLAEFDSVAKETGGMTCALGVLSDPSAEDWAGVGCRMVLDPLTPQVLAFDAVRQAFTRYKEGTAGPSMADLWPLYSDLAEYAGLEELYEIERVTTEIGT
jgi:methylisocitrate lyase